MTATRQQLDDAGELRAVLSGYLEDQLAVPVRIENLQRLAGGASHETWAFDAVATNTPAPQALVLRRDFAHRLLDTKLESEFQLLQLLHEHELPVPRPRWYLAPVAGLGTCAMIMDRAAGTDLRKVLASKPNTLDREKLGLTLVALQAQIHQLTRRVDLGHLSDDSSVPIAAGLEHWAAGCTQAQSPLLLAAITWLRIHTPTAQGAALIHGDFKTNNLVFDETDGIVVLDWEMAHIGDPIEDLAWTMLWQSDTDLVGGMLAPDAYLAAYEQAAGIKIETQRLFFWQLFSLVKLASIFMAGVKPAADVSAPRPMLLMLGRALPWLEAKIGRLLATTVC